MSFYEPLQSLKSLPFESLWQQFQPEDVLAALSRTTLNERDLLALLSPAAQPLLENIAAKAAEITRRHFGHTMLLFTPIYVADFCVNHCTYCSFSSIHAFPRKKLSMEELDREAERIAGTGLKHLLVLTGESRTETPVSYIRECIERLRRHFSSVSVEIYPLRTEEYKELIASGADGLTIYQEVYDEAIYKELHVKGPKRNYRNRLDAPERGCEAGFRGVNIGALLGLADWRQEAFYTVMHAKYLQDRYPECEISLSPPRIRPHLGAFQPASRVGDREFVQILLAYRLFLPRSGITLSTREPAELRDRLIHLGITKMSAGVSTQVGGHSHPEEAGAPQFEISDDRGVQDIRSMLYASGLQPVFKDWEDLLPDELGLYM